MRPPRVTLRPPLSLGFKAEVPGLKKDIEQTGFQQLKSGLGGARIESGPFCSEGLPEKPNKLENDWPDD
jgi:hypothetical protein